MLVEAMKERGIRESLVKRVKKILWETKSIIESGWEMKWGRVSGQGEE